MPSNRSPRSQPPAEVLAAVEAAEGTDAHGFVDADLRQRIEGAAAPADEALLRCALGLVLRQRGHVDDANREFLATVERSDDPALIGRALTYSAGIEVFLGRFDTAEDRLAAAGELVGPEFRPRLLVQRGYLMEMREQLSEAERWYGAAADAALAVGDAYAWSVALNNRSSVALRSGRVGAAELDLRAVIARASPAARVLPVALDNLGQVLGRRGAVREALQRIDEAALLLGENRFDGARFVIARIEILLGAGLLDEAAQVALAALLSAEEREKSLEYPEILVLLGRVELGRRDLEAAVDRFAEAANRFGAQGRRASEEQTRVVLDVLAGYPPIEMRPTEFGGDAVVEALVAAADADPARAAGYWPIVAGVADAVGQRRRVLGAYAMVRHALTVGERPLVEHALGWLFHELDRVVADVSSVELRAAAVHGLVDMEGLVVDVARASSHDELVGLLDRLSHLVHGHATLGVEDAELVERLRELRTNLAYLAPSELRDGELEALEQRIRSLARRKAPARSELGPTPAPADAGGDIVAYVVRGRHVWRLHRPGPSTGGAPPATSLVDLGPIAPIHRLVRELRFAASVLARPPRRPLDGSNALVALDRAAAALDAALLVDLSDCAPGTRTIVGGRSLTGVPWRLLPRAREWALALNVGTPFGLPPSGRFDPGTRLLAAAGPGLGPRADDELRGVAAVYGSARVLDGVDASVAAVLDGLGSVDVAHLAAHGSLHASDPMLSMIDLSDGPLTAYDLELLASTPPTVVLAACDLAAVGPTGVAVAYGLASVLASRGTTQIVLSPLELHDGLTSVVMPALHRELAGGALARDALHRLRFDDSATQRAADSLLCVEAWPLGNELNRG